MFDIVSFDFQIFCFVCICLVWTEASKYCLIIFGPQKMQFCTGLSTAMSKYLFLSCVSLVIILSMSLYCLWLGPVWPLSCLVAWSKCLASFSIYCWSIEYSIVSFIMYLLPWNSLHEKYSCKTLSYVTTCCWKSSSVSSRYC